MLDQKGTRYATDYLEFWRGIKTKIHKNNFMILALHRKFSDFGFQHRLKKPYLFTLSLMQGILWEIIRCS